MKLLCAYKYDRIQSALDEAFSIHRKLGINYTQLKINCNFKHSNVRRIVEKKPPKLFASVFLAFQLVLLMCYSF